MKILFTVIISLLCCTVNASSIVLEDFAPPNNTYMIQDLAFDVTTNNLFGLYRTRENGQARLLVWNPLGNIIDDIGLNFVIGINRGADLVVHDGIIAISDTDMLSGPLFGSIQRYRVEIPLPDVTVPEPAAWLLLPLGIMITWAFFRL